MPLYFKMLQAKERVSIFCLFTVFTLDSHLNLARELGNASTFDMTNLLDYYLLSFPSCFSMCF
jgi:hypothetical protein